MLKDSGMSVKRTLRLAQLVLAERVERARLPSLDDMCHRVLIQLAGEHGQPLVAISVFMSMRRRGIQPNAVTYAIYHRAVLEVRETVETR